MEHNMPSEQLQKDTTLLTWDETAILQRLTQVREHLRLNITQFAKGCGLTYEQIYRLYAQHSLRTLKPEQLHALCSTYSINLMWLLYGQQPMLVQDCKKQPTTSVLLPFYGLVGDALDHAAIWERLKRFRKEYGISMQELAQVCGFSRTYLYRLSREGSPVVLPVTALHNLYVSYGLNPLWVLYGMHSTHNDLLVALQNTSDSIRFDLFVRLYTYFASRDLGAFNHGCEQGTSVPGATWDGTYFKPVAPTQTELTEGETAMTFL